MIKNAVRFAGQFDNYSTKLLLNVYSQGPQRLREAILHLTEEELTVFPFKDKWSIKEIAFHLLDSELMGTIRFRLVITKAGQPFPFYNQDVWTKQMEYQEREIYELEEALETFSLLRKTNTRLLESLHPEHWKLTGMHPENGEMTLRQLLELYADHSERHIDQILSRRRIFGKPVELPILLAKKLY